MNIKALNDVKKLPLESFIGRYNAEDDCTNIKHGNDCVDRLEPTEGQCKWCRQYQRLINMYVYFN